MKKNKQIKRKRVFRFFCCENWLNERKKSEFIGIADESFSTTAISQTNFLIKFASIFLQKNLQKLQSFLLKVVGNKKYKFHLTGHQSKSQTILNTLGELFFFAAKYKKILYHMYSKLNKRKSYSIRKMAVREAFLLLIGKVVAHISRLNKQIYNSEKKHNNNYLANKQKPKHKW